MKPRLLLHICCGPCAISPVESLRAEGFEVVGLFYNPNIHPLQEYLRRAKALSETAARLDIQVLSLHEEYEPRRYFKAVAGHEFERCSLCYALRLSRTAAYAAVHGFDLFSTTLLYSKFQKHEAIAEAGLAASQRGPAFLYRDFRTGWRNGVDRSKAWGIYRQQYCGCLYSECERYSKELAALA